MVSVLVLVMVALKNVHFKILPARLLFLSTPKAVANLVVIYFKHIGVFLTDARLAVYQ